MSIDNTVAPTEELPPLQIFVRLLHLSRDNKHPRPEIARQAKVQLQWYHARGVPELEQAFDAGYKDSDKGVFPQSAHPAYANGFQAGIYEQKFL